MTNKQEKIIRVGSRKSELALIQTKHVIARLQKLYTDKKFEIHTMSTIGDRVLNISLPKIGEKSLFTRDLEDALRNGGVDFVVHSLKDLPTALPLGMAIGAILEREDSRDALVLRENFKDHTIATLPEGSILGTSSLRRTAQIKRQYPHLVVCDIRGNLNTRLAKLDANDSKFAGIILAYAGLVRMGWINRVSQILDPTDLLYAVGQGALAVECRANDQEILPMLQSLMCVPTMCRTLAERSFLKTLGGGCSAPVAVWSTLKDSITDTNSNDETELSLVGAVLSLDGSIEIRSKMSSSLMLTNKDDIFSDDNNSSDTNNDNHIPNKRPRRESPTISSNRGSPEIINEDEDVDKLSTSYNIKTIIEKHIDLAKKCPVIGADVQRTYAPDNGNIVKQRGGGDADTLDNHCPLHINVGQDVMGQCPFVNNETKVIMANIKKCPTTNYNDDDANKNSDSTDCVSSTSSKCPFSKQQSDKKTDANQTGSENVFELCPFLQKTVQMFDYADEEKPKSRTVPTLLTNEDNLYCGLYHHSCFNDDLYVKCNKLGEQLAEELIKKGALDVMKCAQAEIHSKS